ncbi:MAG TPA: hypothetical protein VFI90_03640 [Rubrobacter sp.]|nr:hypothetical protein [Rubrobacter sp.]
MGPFGVKWKKGDPADMIRRLFSDHIKEGDVLEYVRAVRDGKVMAVMQYLREGGGWIEGASSACEGL